MSAEEQEYIKKIAQELATASHQSRDREVSGLFKEINNKLDNLERDIKEIRKSVQDLESDYKEKVLPNVKTWDGTAEALKWGIRIVVGILITAIVGLVVTQ